MNHFAGEMGDKWVSRMLNRPNAEKKDLRILFLGQAATDVVVLQSPHFSQTPCWCVRQSSCILCRSPQSVFAWCTSFVPSACPFLVFPLSPFASTNDYRSDGDHWRREEYEREGGACRVEND